MDSIPTEAQIATLLSLPADAPLAVLNLFKFNERARYQPEDPEFGTPDADVSGREAFERYKLVSDAKIQAAGGRIAFRTPVDQVMIGTDAVDFDLVAVMFFPTRGAFVSIMGDPEVAATSRHRDASLSRHNMLHLDGEPFATTAS